MNADERFRQCEGALARERIAHRETRRLVERLKAENQRLRDDAEGIKSMIPAIRRNLDAIEGSAMRSAVRVPTSRAKGGPDAGA